MSYWAERQWQVRPAPEKLRKHLNNVAFTAKRMHRLLNLSTRDAILVYCTRENGHQCFADLSVESLRIHSRPRLFWFRAHEIRGGVRAAAAAPARNLWIGTQQSRFLHHALGSVRRNDALRRLSAFYPLLKRRQSVEGIGHASSKALLRLSRRGHGRSRTGRMWARIRR